MVYSENIKITENTRKTAFAPTIILANTDQIFDPVYLLAEFHTPVSTTIAYTIAANIETTINPNELDLVGTQVSVTRKTCTGNYLASRKEMYPIVTFEDWDRAFYLSNRVIYVMEQDWSSY